MREARPSGAPQRGRHRADEQRQVRYVCRNADSRRPADGASARAYASANSTPAAAKHVVPHIEHAFVGVLFALKDGERLAAADGADDELLEAMAAPALALASASACELARSSRAPLQSGSGPLCTLASTSSASAAWAEMGLTPAASRHALAQSLSSTSQCACPASVSSSVASLLAARAYASAMLAGRTEP